MLALSFLLRFLVAGGVDGLDVLTDDTGSSTCSMSIFRFFLGGDFGFINSGLSGNVPVLSEMAFAFFAFAFTLASSRRAFRA